MWEKLISLIGKLAETYLLTFVLLFGVGLILLAMGATGGVSQFGVTVPETLWRYIIGACGIIVLAAGVIFAFVAMRISPRKSLDAKSLGISIDYPGDGDHVTVPCKISGRSKGPPRGAKLWLFTISGYGRGIRYWPQDGIEVKNGTWRTELRATRFSAGDKRSFAIFLVGEDGQALIHHFKVAGKSINDLGSKGSGLPWPGIEALTSDMSQATETREVTLTGR